MALPCIVCGRELREALQGFSVNQPSEGVLAIIDGNYGSTVFDPMNGEMLQVNICDPCLVEAGELGRVVHGRNSRPVIADYLGIVGHEEVEYIPVLWNRGLSGFEDSCHIEIEDLDRLPERIHLNLSIEYIRKVILEKEADG